MIDNLAGTKAERCGKVGTTGDPVNAAEAPWRAGRRSRWASVAFLLILAFGLVIPGASQAKVPSGARVLARLKHARVLQRPLVLSLQRQGCAPARGVGGASGAAAAGQAGGTRGPGGGGGLGEGASASPQLMRWILGTHGRARADLLRLSPRGSRVRYLSPDRVPPWLRLLAGDPAADVAAAVGVDTAKTSLAHDGGTILVVVGAGPHQRTRPQLPQLPQFHVEQDTGRLRRIVWADTLGATHDVRLGGELVLDGAPTGWPARLVERVGQDERRWALVAVHEGVILEPGTLTPPPSPAPARSSSSSSGSGSGAGSGAGARGSGGPAGTGDAPSGRAASVPPHAPGATPAGTPKKPGP